MVDDNQPMLQDDKVTEEALVEAESEDARPHAAAVPGFRLGFSEAPKASLAKAIYGLWHRRCTTQRSSANTVMDQITATFALADVIVYEYEACSWP